MRNRQTLLISAGIILILVTFLGACQRAGTEVTQPITDTASPSLGLEVTETVVPTEVLYTAQVTPSEVQTTAEVYPQPGVQTLAPTASATQTAYPSPLPSATKEPTQSAPASATQSVETPTSTATVAGTIAYPGPGIYPTLTQPYPGPYITSTQAAYPSTGTSTPRPSLTPVGSKTPTQTHGAIITGAPTVIGGSGTPMPTIPGGIGTPQSTPFELPPPRPVSPPPAGSSVTIWHAWNNTETDTLREIIQSFQRLYPDVTISLQYIPLDDLYNTYYTSAYQGYGPSLLLGPASWGPKLYDQSLVADIDPYVPPDFLSDINPAALASGNYHGSLISLPLSQRGMVLFRNASIIDTAAQTFDELDLISHQVTRAGIVGTYLERGAFFSAADIPGLGGMLMDEQGYPAFDSNIGLEWFDLLADYDKAGAVTFNTNRDLDMFKRGRVGIIIDGTWNISLLQDIIGVENLAIDPWPVYGTGHMSGWVEADSIFLNSNTTEDDRYAALAFMGYLLDPGVQMMLAEVGHIPSVSIAQPRNALIRQAMVAFSNGAPYPITVDEHILQLYWSVLDNAIKGVFLSGDSPANVLKTASDKLNTEINNLQTLP
jgi:arabinogalactan oligomer/maltooligosaccharide transport system substrate-binding protein